MIWFFVIFYAGSIASVISNEYGPRYPPTKGQIWPKPQQQITDKIFYTFNPEYFNVTIVEETCNKLVKAIERYSFIVRDADRIARRVAGRSLNRQHRFIVRQDENYEGNIHQLLVKLTSPCEDYPYFGMVESYTLTVAPISELTSTSLWGIMRGLESWSQLFYIPNDKGEIRINKTVIHDTPKYSHRGLLIDTSRHYISLSKIIKTLDAMMMNKMNVLHWHIVDDESFPYESEKFPDLSWRGAYHRSMVYTQTDIRMVIQYAAERGIRVIPEFDVPGHTRSWGEAYPNILTQCFSQGVVTGLGPLNPIHNVTFKFLQDLFNEVQDLFPDQYFHVGGDEVNLECWISNPDIIAFMLQNNIPKSGKLLGYFIQKVLPLLDRKKTIVWQEVFDEEVVLSKDTFVQVWKSGDYQEMITVLRAGYKVIFSSAWYLDQLHSGGDWTTLYQADPRDELGHYASQLPLDNIVGGEACMWGEVVDDNNIMSRVWPRASAVAERLWSPSPSDSDESDYPRIKPIPDSVFHRLEEHVCRMNRRGIAAQPASGPGFCLGAL